MVDIFITELVALELSQVHVKDIKFSVLEYANISKLTPRVW